MDIAQHGKRDKIQSKARQTGAKRNQEGSFEVRLHADFSHFGTDREGYDQFRIMGVGFVEGSFARGSQRLRGQFSTDQAYLKLTKVVTCRKSHPVGAAGTANS
jgi:hypothetical protein